MKRVDIFGVKSFFSEATKRQFKSDEWWMKVVHLSGYGLVCGRLHAWTLTQK